MRGEGGPDRVLGGQEQSSSHLLCTYCMLFKSTQLSISMYTYCVKGSQVKAATQVE